VIGVGRIDLQPIGVTASRSSELAHTATAVFASEVAGEATAVLLRVVEVDVGRSTDEVKRLDA